MKNLERRMQNAEVWWRALSRTRVSLSQFFILRSAFFIQILIPDELAGVNCSVYTPLAFRTVATA